MILVDMVGGDNLRFINEQYSTSSLLDELFQTGRQLGFTSAFPSNPIIRSITDDHVAFVNYGIPAADLIIKFWDAPVEWPYHHTASDDLSHISNQSLQITGKTVEQFIYNNYYENGNSFHGNSPWTGDSNLLEPELFFLLVIFIPIIIVTLVIFYIRLRKSNRLLN
jgi:hypothetical protein